MINLYIGNLNIKYAISSFITLFIIVDPVLSIPIFISILANFSKNKRKEIIKKAVFVAAIVLIIFTLIGNTIFEILGIQMYSFMIASGILLFVISIEMLFGIKPGTKGTKKEEVEAITKEDVTITPLAIPLLTGPGSMTTSIVLYHSADTLADSFVILINIIIVYFLAYIILSKSEKVYDILGHTGTMVIVRIMGLLLAAISVQFVINGIKEIR